jgi:copper(I)-binding protein
MRFMVWAAMVAAIVFSNSVLAEISIDNAWARLLPPTVKTTAGYLDISSTKDDRLISASSSSATVIEIHQTTMADGVMSMNQVEGVDVLAGTPLSLAPGGFHLMIKGLLTPLKDGQILPLVLEFEHSGSVMLEMPVRAN